MVDKKTGPVKPPVIDMTARESAPKDEARPATVSTQAEAKPAEEPKPAPEKAKAPEKPQPAKPAAPAPKPEAAATAPLWPLAATGLGGAVLGLGMAYGLASLNLWPQQTPAIAPSALTALEQRLSRSENARELGAAAVTALGQRLDGAEAELTDLATGLDARLETLLPQDTVSRQELADLAGQLTALSHAIDALQAGASSEDAARIGSDLAALSASLADIDARLAPLSTQIADLTTGNAEAEARLAELEVRIADQPQVEEIRAERDRLARIPAAIGALEAGVSAGTPFAPALAALEELLPTLEVPQAARLAAATGVKPVNTLLAEYRALLPALLAARPADPNAGWFETLVDQARSAVALRPTGEVEGDTPDALLATAEAALERGDAATALSTLAALPPPMRAVAEPVLAGLGARFAADDLLDQARALAFAAPATAEGQQ